MGAVSSGRASVNVRSVTVGLAGVVLLCALTPYNDFAVNNTYLIGSYIPIGIVLLISMLVMLINAPLRRRRSALAVPTDKPIEASAPSQ